MNPDWRKPSGPILQNDLENIRGPVKATQNSPYNRWAGESYTAPILTGSLALNPKPQTLKT